MLGKPKRGVLALLILGAIGCGLGVLIVQFRACSSAIAARNIAYQASTGVRALGTAARQMLADGKMPATAEWTPRGRACDQPGRYFPFDAKPWQMPPWSELGFSPSTDGDDVPVDGIYYQFRITRPTPGEVLVEARGDLDCDGTFSRFAQTVTKDSTSPLLTPSDARE